MDQVLLPDIDVELTGLALTASLWELFTTWFRGDLEIDRDHLIDYTVALVLTTTELPTSLHHHLR